EVRGAVRHGEGDVRGGFQQTVRDLLEPRSTAEGRMLVNDRGNASKRARPPAERRRAITMKMPGVDLLFVDDAEQRRQREWVELGALQVPDVDPKGVEGFLREVLLAQADERDLKPLPIEAGDHPAEQPLDAVHARPLPPEVIANLQDIERGI